MKPIDVVVAVLVPAVVAASVRLLTLRDELVSLRREFDGREGRLRELEEAVDPSLRVTFERRPMLAMMNGKGVPAYARRGLLQRVEALEAALKKTDWASSDQGPDAA